MNNVVKYDAYLEILLVGSIDVTTYVVFNKMNLLPAIPTFKWHGKQKAWKNVMEANAKRATTTPRGIL